MTVKVLNIKSSSLPRAVAALFASFQKDILDRKFVVILANRNAEPFIKEALERRTISIHRFPTLKIIYDFEPKSLMGLKPDLMFLLDVEKKFSESIKNNIISRSKQVYIFTI